MTVAENFFTPSHLTVVNKAVAVAEEMVCDYYKMSASQWLRHRYDVRTQAELSPAEIVEGPFAQIIRYRAYQKGKQLGSASYDFYKICLQDQAMLAALAADAKLSLFPFCVYVVIHELVHIVRFARFRHRFEASQTETQDEEARVHEITRAVLSDSTISGMPAVLRFYAQWCQAGSGPGENNGAAG